jgi:hypothetical protein
MTQKTYSVSPLIPACPKPGTTGLRSGQARNRTVLAFRPADQGDTAATSSTEEVCPSSVRGCGTFAPASWTATVPRRSSPASLRAFASYRKTKPFRAEPPTSPWCLGHSLAFGIWYLVISLCAFASCRFSGAALICTGLCADSSRPLRLKISNQKYQKFANLKSGRSFRPHCTALFRSVPPNQVFLLYPLLCAFVLLYANSISSSYLSFVLGHSLVICALSFVISSPCLRVLCGRSSAPIFDPIVPHFFALYRQTKFFFIPSRNVAPRVRESLRRFVGMNQKMKP